jgi:hypothetical protein
MAPGAAAAASFKKHSRPYARPVMHRKTLNIKNEAIGSHENTFTLFVRQEPRSRFLSFS